MNIFTREMKANRKSIIIWCLGAIALIAGGMSKYAALSSSGGSITELMDVLPKSLLNMMGISGFDISTAIGFYGVLFLYIIVMTTIHAVMLGSNIIAKEETDKTTEFLLVKPVSRNKVITSKLLAAVLNIVILNIVTFAASLVAVNYFKEGDSITSDIALLMGGMFILQIMFMSIGSLMATVKKHSKGVASTATGVLLVTFMLSMIINMNDKLENLKYLTPFKYFEAQAVIGGNGFEAIFIVLSLVIIVLCLIGTYRFYEKRDLNI